MPATQHNSPLALTYARSLLELASEQNSAEAVGQEMQALGTILGENPTFADVFRDPGISSADRTALLDKIFRGRVSQLVMNFLGVMNNHGRLGILGEVAAAYDDLLNDLLGKIEVDVTSAQKLAPDQIEMIRQRIGQALGKDVVIHTYVDDSIIAGLVIRVEDKLIDASTKYQLKAIREQLLAAGGGKVVGSQ